MRTMRSAASCSLEKLVIAGRLRRRMPFGTETLWGKRTATTRCRDCGVRAGAVHHVGCDIEQCPVCGAQLFCCDCAKRAPTGLKVASKRR